MKALTILQPWATLVAIGAKRFETRSWRTASFGRLAIHAGGRCVPLCLEIFDQEPFRSVLAAAGFHQVEDLPFGAVVAVADLVALHRTEVLAPRLGRNERRFGNFSPGRWAWELSHVQRLERPIAAGGRQGLWEWTAPAHLEER